MIPRRFMFCRIITAVLFLLGVPVTGCAKEEYDDAYYAKAHTVTLLPKETKDPKATPPSYYRFQISRGYVSGGSLPQSTLLKVYALYPSMEHFSRSRREAWYTKTPNGEWGPHVKDVLWIFLEYFLSDENDEGLLFSRSLEHQHDKKYLDVVAVPNELIKKIPALKIYQNRQNTLDRHYIFRQSDGRIVVVKCDLECTGRTTWNGKLRLHYQFPEARLSEMAEIDTAVNKLIDSFQPTLIEKRK